jgi:hypothetical protein
MLVTFEKTENFYDDVCNLWAKYDHQIINKDYLPDLLIKCADNKNNILCFAFPYFVNASGIILDYFVGNKEYSKQDRKLAINLIMEFAEKFCEEKGLKYIYAITNNENMAKHYVENGFKLSGTNVKSFFKEI